MALKLKFTFLHRPLRQFVRLKLRYKILITFLGLSITSLTLLSVLIYNRAKEAIQSEQYEHLESVAEIKTQQVKDYFRELNTSSYLLAHTALVRNAFRDFSTAFDGLKNLNLVSSDSLKSIQTKRKEKYLKDFYKRNRSDFMTPNALSAMLPSEPEALMLNALFAEKDPVMKSICKDYYRTFQEYDPEIARFVQNMPFSNVSFIDRSGRVIYSNMNQRNLGSSVYDRVFQNTNIGTSFDKILFLNRDTSLFCDYSSYFFNYYSQTSFLITPLIINGKNIGAILFEISSGNISRIVNFNYKWFENGLGKSGTAVLIGSDLKLRSESRFFLENRQKFIEELRSNGYSESNIQKIQSQNTTVGNLMVKNIATKTGIGGKKAKVFYRDYLGHESLAITKPISVFGLNWALVVKVRTEEAFEDLKYIQWFSITCLLLTIFFTIGITFYISFKITRPLLELTEGANEISKGNFNKRIEGQSKDEIGSLSKAFNKMQSKIRELIGSLRTSNELLVETQSEIMDSIRYASRIQQNLLASEQLLKSNLPHYFIFYKPRDIVSGDFYWATFAGKEVTHKERLTENNTGNFYLGVCDSTGHGIPGAFMSILNSNFLKQAIVENKLEATGEIFDFVRDSLVKTFSYNENKDGMDAILLSIKKDSSQIQYSAANNKPVLIRDNTYTCLECDKMAIGKGLKSNQFSTFNVEVRAGDMLYLFTDGFPDQFGGILNKKYKYKRFYELLLKIHQLDTEEQRLKLEEEFESWKGTLVQTDDVLVVGIRF